MKDVLIALWKLILGLLTVLWKKCNPPPKKYEHQLITYHPDGSVQSVSNHLMDYASANNFVYMLVQGCRSSTPRKVVKRCERDEWRIIFDTNEVKKWYMSES